MIISYRDFNNFIQKKVYVGCKHRQDVLMSSKSNDDHSSSSPVSDNQNRRDGDHGQNRSRSRSRSRDKNRYRQDRDYDRSKDSRKKHKVVVRVPEITSELMSFRAFLNQQNDKISKEVAEKQYEIYKNQWQQKSNKAFFVEHKNDAWFQQRYNPEVLDAIQRERKERIIKNSQEFAQQFINGVYSEIDLSIKQYTQLGFICNERDDQFDQLRDVGASNNQSGVPINFQTVDINVSTKINLSAPPFYGFDPDVNTIFIKAIPRNISKFDIFEIVGKLDGFQSITLSEPAKKLHFSRYCWISFTNEDCMRKAENQINGLTIKGEPIAFGHSSSRSRRVKILKKYPMSRIATDADVVKRLAAKLDQDCGITGNILMQAQFPSSRKQLDTFLLYLRRVHAHDYYTSTTYPNQRALCLKLGRAFLRAQADYEQAPGIPTIFKQMQNAAQTIITNGIPVPDHMLQLRQQIEKMIIKHISETENVPIEGIRDRQVWECMYCKKKFKTCEFAAKHIIMKHPEAKDKHLHYIMEIAYTKDPHKITNYQISGRGDDRESGNRMRRPGGYRRGRGREYRDLDDPEMNHPEKQKSKSINFLDI